MHTDANTRLVGPGAIHLKYDSRYAGILMEIHHVSIHLQHDEVAQLMTQLFLLGRQHFSEEWPTRVLNTLREKGEHE